LPSFVDGRSLLPLFQGQNPSSWRQALLLEHKAGAGSKIMGIKGTREVADPWDLIEGQGYASDGFVGLRTADGTTYIEYETGEHEIYNNGSDAAQLRNSYNNTPWWTRDDLHNWTSALKSASGAALRQAELDVP